LPATSPDFKFVKGLHRMTTRRQCLLGSGRKLPLVSTVAEGHLSGSASGT
jgi:hypothetical protein